MVNDDNISILLGVFLCVFLVTLLRNKSYVISYVYEYEARVTNP